MRVVYLSYDVSFFLMLALLLPVYRRSLSALCGGTGVHPHRYSPV